MEKKMIKDKYEVFKDLDISSSTELLKQIQKNGTVVFGASGEMGSKISSTFARANTPVIMQDINEKKLIESKEAAISTLEKAASKKKLSKKQLEIIKQRKLINEIVIFPEGGEIPFNEINSPGEANSFLDKSIPALKEKYSSSYMLLEAGPEITSFKEDVFKFFNYALKNKNAVLATNTSSLKVDDIGSKVENPERVVGFHYFLPAHINALVEIIAGTKTSPEVIQTMQNLAISMGKKPIIAWKDSNGAIANRILVGVLNEAAKLYDEGLGPQSLIDKIFLETFYPKQITIATSKAQKQFQAAPKLSFFKDEKSLYKKVREEKDLTKKKELLETAEGRLRQKVLYAQILENHAELGSFFTPAPCVAKLKVKAQEQIKKIKEAINDIENNIENDFEITTYDFPKPSSECHSRLDRESIPTNQVLDSHFHGNDIISNRLKAAYICISQQIYLEEIATIHDIELACKEGFKWNIGPFELIYSLGKDEVERLSKLANEKNGGKTGVSKSGEVVTVNESDISGIQTYTQNNIGFIVLGRLHIQNLQMMQNSLGPLTLRALESAIKNFSAEGGSASGGENSTVKAIVIKSQGGGAFCSGADLDYINGLNWDMEKILAYRNLGKKIMNEIANCKKPTVAIVDGPAIGGGLELALACDYRVMTDQAFVAMPEVALGIIPDWGGTERLPAIIGKELAKRMICTAELKNLGLKLNAEDAYALGLADVFCLQSELPIIVTDLIKGNGKVDIYKKSAPKSNHERKDYPENIVKKFGLNKPFKHKPRWITCHAAKFAEKLIEHSDNLSYSKRVDDDDAFRELIKSGKLVSQIYINPFISIAQNKVLAPMFEKIGLL